MSRPPSSSRTRRIIASNSHEFGYPSVRVWRSTRGEPSPRRPMKPFVPSRLVAALVLCLAGCGLGDYEARMLDAQQHGAERQAERARQETLQANLDEPLQVPKPP